MQTKLYDKRDDFNFAIVNFPFICSNITTAPAYAVYISQLMRYSRACGSYQDFFDRGLLLTRKLLNQWFLLVKLKSSLRRFYCRHHDLVDRYGHFPVLSSFITFHWICNQINSMGVTSGAGTANPSGALDFIPGFQWGSCYSTFSFLCNACPFVLFPLAIVFNLRIIITPLVSSNFSQVNARSCYGSARSVKVFIYIIKCIT